MARAQGARAQMALAYETVYGTPPVSGFRLMPFARATLGSEQPLLESELLGNWPADLRDWIEAMNARNYPAINNGVYRAGFVTTQFVYDEACTRSLPGWTGWKITWAQIAI